MTHYIWTIVVTLLLSAVLTGCTEQHGSSKSLGDIGYASAFASGREVMSQYFSVESADPSTGEIKSRPKEIELKGERLLGGSHARQVAVLRLNRKNGKVVAHAMVSVQRQGSDVFRQMKVANENYDSVPNQTPAEIEAATTPEQNETWQTEYFDHSLENKILEDLYKALSPASTP